jgi:hypothetical protein
MLSVSLWQLHHHRRTQPILRIDLCAQFRHISPFSRLLGLIGGKIWLPFHLGNLTMLFNSEIITKVYACCGALAPVC